MGGIVLEHEPRLRAPRRMELDPRRMRNAVVQKTDVVQVRAVFQDADNLRSARVSEGFKPTFTKSAIITVRSVIVVEVEVETDDSQIRHRRQRARNVLLQREG